MAESTRAHKEVDTGHHHGRSRRDFVRAMLSDLRALERMLQEKRFEHGVRRIGAELEMFLTDQAFQPAAASLQMLEQLKDPHFTTELGLFQLEMNADPQGFGGDGFSKMESQMRELVDRTRKAAEELGLHALLMGILPTIRKQDLGLHNMVPSPRYLALSKAVQELRGGNFQISI
ncbi:MAG: glutamate-cysteine ligase family protein, partial [Myxococcaceae bacterium]